MHFSIATPDMALAPALRDKIDRKTKPLGSLGRLERLALQVGLVQHSLTPRLVDPQLLVFAADHGSARAGISAYPPEVTWQMVENFLAGGAAINVLAREAGMELTVVDAGVDHEFAPRTQLIDAKIAAGTASYLDGAAMSGSQCAAALEIGASIVRRLARRGCNVLGIGEMGIGNTASAAILTHLLTGAALTACIGRGTGLDDAGLARKRELLARALAGAPAGREPLALLAHFGGFEIAQMTGAMLAAAEQRMLILVDGFIVTSAVLVAAALEPRLLAYCIFSHRSQEPGHPLQLAHLGVEPLLDLDLRLGEGTGAALAYPLVRAATAILNEMASFESAAVSGKRV